MSSSFIPLGAIKREGEVLQVFKKWGLDAVVVGEVAEGGLLRVKDRGKIVAEIPAHPLAEEGPVYQRPMARRRFGSPSSS